MRCQLSYNNSVFRRSIRYGLMKVKAGRQAVSQGLIVPTCDSLRQIQSVAQEADAPSSPTLITTLGMWFAINLKCLRMGFRLLVRCHLRIRAVLKSARSHGPSEELHSELADYYDELQQTIADVEDVMTPSIALAIPLHVLKRTSGILSTYLEDVAMLAMAETILAKLDQYEVTPEGERILTNAV